MSDFIGQFKKMAETVGGMLGGPLVPAGIEIAQDFLQLITKAKTVVNTNDAAELQAIHDDLMPKVMAHADRTEADLRG